MSMYGMVLGDGHEHDRGAVLLEILGIPNPGRYRDSWVEQDPTRPGKVRIAIYTRNGGGNREHYDEDTKEGPECGCTGCVATFVLPRHPLHIFNRDDEFDHTYATFYFAAPPKFEEQLAAIAQDPVNMDEVWRGIIDAMGGGL